MDVRAALQPTVFGQIDYTNYFHRSGIKAEGWKWEQGDWKAGCDFDMKGKVAGGRFTSEEKRKNPDTLERDHGSLIVNRLDDVLAALLDVVVGADRHRLDLSLGTDHMLERRAKFDGEPPVRDEYETDHGSPRRCVPGCTARKGAIMTIRRPRARADARRIARRH